MFGTLIDVDTDGNIFAHSKAISLLPNMFSVYKDKYLGSKAVKWIVCMYDYKSPYRSLPMEQRKQIVNNTKENILRKTEEIFTITNLPSVTIFSKKNANKTTIVKSIIKDAYLILNIVRGENIFFVPGNINTKI